MPSSSTAASHCPTHAPPGSRMVHGPSQVLDHGAFPWTDERWQPVPLASAVLYELHVGTFTPAGTFGGGERAPRSLVTLGITCRAHARRRIFRGPGLGL
jgi:pullulanase/glycogen debranching enzyme